MIECECRNLSIEELEHIRLLNDHIAALTQIAVKRYERMNSVLEKHPDLFDRSCYDVRLYIKAPQEIYEDQSLKEFNKRVEATSDYDICVDSPENPYPGPGIQGYQWDVHGIKLCRGLLHFFINQRTLSFKDMMMVQPDWFDITITIHV